MKSSFYPALVSFFFLILTTCSIAQNDPGPNTGDLGSVDLVYQGDTVTYITVRSADGFIWLQQNLGSTQVATSLTDAAAFGHRFQWGRWEDGHQLGSAATAQAATLSPNNPEGLGDGQPFFYIGNNPNDWWGNGTGTDTWSGDSITSTNGKDPCTCLGPGWFLPSQGDWENMVAVENITDLASAFASGLKLTAAGMREGAQGNVLNVGTAGNYWTSTPSGVYAKDVTILDNAINTNDDAYRSYGFPVRCMNSTCTGVMTPQTILGPDSICPGSIQEFAVTVVNNADGYLWTIPADWTLESSSGTTLIVTTGAIGGEVSVVAHNDCGNSAALSIPVDVFPGPAPVITANGNMLSAGDFETYQWYLNGQPIEDANASTYVTSGPGNYSVLVTDTNGCAALSDSFTGVEEYDARGIFVYPNPASDVLYIAGIMVPDVSIYRMDGQLVMKQKASRKTDISSLPAGIYLVNISSGDGKLYKSERLSITRNK